MTCAAGQPRLHRKLGPDCVTEALERSRNVTLHSRAAPPIVLIEVTGIEYPATPREASLPRATAATAVRLMACHGSRGSGTRFQKRDVSIPRRRSVSSTIGFCRADECHRRARNTDSRLRGTREFGPYRARHNNAVPRIIAAISEPSRRMAVGERDPPLLLGHRLGRRRITAVAGAATLAICVRGSGQWGRHPDRPAR